MFSASMQVKFVLPNGEQPILRRIDLPKGKSTSMREMLAICEARFQKTLSSSVTYEDNESDLITVSSDAELKQALQTGVQKLHLAIWEADDDEWEVLGSSGSTVSQPSAQPSARLSVDSWTSSITFWVDGEKVTLQNPKPSVTLLDWLREDRGLTAVHVGCGEGGCGICTVALVKASGETVPINSCLRRLCAVDGCHIVTTQGLGDVQNGLHPIQKSIADGNGSQCGFCTPGWVMNMYALLERNPTPTKEQVEQNFDGNLCRCTGYRPILTAFGEHAQGGKCCGQHHSAPRPAELLSYEPKPLHFTDTMMGQEWFRPLTLEQLAAAQEAATSQSKTLRYICAGTADGVLKYLAPANHDQMGTTFADVSSLAELNYVSFDSQALRIGSSVPIATLIDALQEYSNADPAFQTYAEHLKRVASVQIRAVGSWAGNVMLCRESTLNPKLHYFPSDLVLVLTTAGATFTILKGGQQLEMNALDLMGLKGDVFVQSVSIPVAPWGTVIQTYKVMQRHVFSHAIVNLGVHATFNEQKIVQDARIVIGGATSHIVVAKQATAMLIGKCVSQETLAAVTLALAEDIKVRPSSDPVNTQEYRESLAAGFLYKWFLQAMKATGNGITSELESALVPFTPADSRPVSSGTEDFSVDAAIAPLSEHVIKLEARSQATGDAKYASDLHVGALFGQIVFAHACGAKLTVLDASNALTMPGVRDFVFAKDIPGQNFLNGVLTGKIFHAVGDDVDYIGAPLGLIVADSWAQARLAAKKVLQRYGDSASPVVSAEEAAELGRIASQEATLSALADPAKLMGLPRHARSKFAPGERSVGADRQGADQVVKGQLVTGGQSHLFLETNATVVMPVDGDRFEVWCGSQNHTELQSVIATALGVTKHKVLVHNQRVGGGFGGKIHYCQPFAAPVAVAAHKLRRTIRLQNERSDDMQMMGNRHPISFSYEATFDTSGKIGSLNIDGQADSGWRGAGFGPTAASGTDNNYKWAKHTAGGEDRLTNKPQNTAMRAPPSMQAALAGDVVIEHIARAAKMDVAKVMEMNFLVSGDESAGGDHNTMDSATCNYTVPRLWAQIRADTKYEERKAAVEQHNKVNKWTKRGIAVTTSRWTAFRSEFLEMGAHLVVHGDGTLSVCTGGAEIGQGLNTKVAQAVAQSLGISMDSVLISDGDTKTLANNGTTGGSMTSEACVAAVQDACDKIKALLEPFTSAGADWQTAVAQAKGSGVNLVTTGRNTGKWNSADPAVNDSPYLVYGACVSEITIDVLTGESRLEKVDVLMDVGTQLNAAVDLGQVQGGFVMALGYLFSEEQKWDSTGKLLNLGTWEYKVPTAYDIPVEFNVGLLTNAPNPNGVMGSKAVAEPAMHLLSSPYLAVKHAIYAARADQGLGEDWFQLNVPCTPEVIRSVVGVSSESMALP